MRPDDTQEQRCATMSTTDDEDRVINNVPELRLSHATPEVGNEIEMIEKLENLHVKGQEQRDSGEFTACLTSTNFLVAPDVIPS